MLNTYKSFLLFLLPLFFINTTNAQLEAHFIDDEGWAKGDFVEIGINSKGVFGAKTTNAPASFHDNREMDSNGLFGFTANPLADGWLDYDGDFFTPGSPEEGFAIEINGTNYNNNNADNLFQIMGEVKSVNSISSDCFEDTAQIFWEGNIQGINIKRYYSVTKEGLFIQMKTVLKNLSNSTKENVFFMHNVDPDNNVTLSGSYETNMELISQASSETDNICLVTASQEPSGTPLDADGSSVSFYASNPNMRVTYGEFNNRVASQIWNGTGLTSTEGSVTSFVDQAISLAINIGDIAPSERVSFTYYYILKEIDESFTPLIVNIFQENPTKCNGSDGKLVFSGLDPNQTYNIGYTDDGIIIPSEAFIANANGDIEIQNLDSGIYTDIEMNYSGCSTNITSAFELKDPEPPAIDLYKSDMTNCDNLDGKIVFENLTPFTNYNYTYSMGDSVIGPLNADANSNGEIVIGNLARGTYSYFGIEQNDCVNLSNRVIVIDGPEQPNINAIPGQFYCDEDYDYITSIDLIDLNSIVLGTDSSSNFGITYHLNENDAINSINLPNTNYSTSGLNSYTLYAKKTSLTSLCYVYVPFTITINLPTQFDLNAPRLCVNSDSTPNYDYDLPIIDTGLSESLNSFKWFFEGELIPGENSSDLMANNFGEFSVSVTNLSNGCSITKSTTVVPSGPPETLEVTIVSNPFSTNHTVEITANGYGDYVYAIDDESYQTSPIFSGISSGFHLFTILDANGCGMVTKEKILIDYLPYFTPNNDGYHDYWQIIGVETLKNPEIYLFDKYGKLIKQISPRSKGWNGKFQNENLPATDYWFKVIFDDKNNNRREFSSNFALKR